MTNTTGSKGFTLIEMLLSVTIIGLLAGLSLPIYESFNRRNDLDVAAQHVSTTLRRAATYARAMYGDSAWSVRIDSTGATLFEGTSYGTRDTAYDEFTEIPGSITVSATTEVQFAKMSGQPGSAASVTLTSSTSDTRVITVNAKGMVSY
jgi:prepilin-type N-terminal cleavage/methylation domain-containing protein